MSAISLLKFPYHLQAVNGHSLSSTQKNIFFKHVPRNWLFLTEGSVFNTKIRCKYSPNAGSSLGYNGELQTEYTEYLDGEVIQSDQKERKERIREMFGKIEVSPSAYDIAWVAMVPSRHYPKQPCFPQCLDWILENQSKDGSWGLSPTHPLLVKDSLSSTLACLLALSKWGIGDKLVQRGLDFIGRHSWSIDNKDQISPLGFDLIFPSMIKYAEEFNLNVPFDQGVVNMLLYKRDSIERMLRNDIKEFTSNLAYYAEGLGELCNWEEVMAYQKQNGSFFNSPATTAAALIYHDYHDEKCLGYINSILDQHKNWVPTTYPTTTHTRLQMVDTLQNLGVDGHFEREIKSVLEETYRLWEQKDEETFSDAACCAVAFRLLRMGSYEVSSEDLAGFIDQEHFIYSSNEQCRSDATVLELHKASQLAVDEKDRILDAISTWTKAYIQQELLNKNTLDRMSQNEVERALRNSNATLAQAEHRHYIESYDVNSFNISKSAYRSPNIYNRDFLLLSVNNFNLCQRVRQEDIQVLKRWYDDSKLQQLRLTPIYIYASYLPISSFFFQPEFSIARIEFAKYVSLMSVVDWFFDNLVSQEELVNLIKLVEGWDGYSTIGCVSERVEILFFALYKTVNQCAAKAQFIQGRCVKHHLINLVIEILHCMMREVEWWREEITPSVEDYMSTACVTVTTKVILFTTHFLLGPKLSEEVLKSDELSEICKCTSMLCRLLNDIQTYEREKEERTTNIIKVLVTKSRGTITEEDALTQVNELIESNRRKLLKMILQKKGSKLPQACKDLFWSTSKIATFLYSTNDGFHSPEEIKSKINTLCYEPIKLSP